MKCPNCGCELTQGHLYCEKCGTEIQMVPDFEPEIENSIIETLSTVAEEIDGGQKLSKQQSDVSQETAGDGESNKGSKNGRISLQEARKSRMMASMIIFVIVVILTVFAGIFLYQRYSVSYQISRARKYAEQERYQDAVRYLERAGKLEPERVDIIVAQAGYYCLLDDKQKALDLLMQFQDTVQLQYEDKELVFERIISILAEEERYEEINSLLLKSEDIEIQTRFQQYMAMTPEFSYDAGTYDKVIPLRISANTTGTIYYTLDGSEPGVESQVYKSPIFLESGEYQLAAVFINDYGIKSTVARSFYMINLTVPDPPQLLLNSGEYNIPTMIEVVLPEEGTVYYTTDGSDPATDSLVYTEPIQMPLGKSNFKFVTISEEGVSSEVVSRSFDFDLKTDVSVKQACTNVVSALYEQKVLRDMQGHSFGIEGRYVFEYDTIVEIPNLGYYYVLKEYIEGTNGSKTQTERLYAVEVYTGKANRLTYGANGEMGLIPLD